MAKLDKKGNSGSYNSGDCNSGSYNSGHRNSGSYNSGDYNSGIYNSGDYNSGNCNSGCYNSSHYNSGYFNTDEPTVRLFNKDSGLKRSEIDLPHINLKLTEWDSEADKLITKTYKEAWALFWQEADEETRQRFLNLPNFNPEIFKEITGINVGQASQESCEGKVFEIEGKKYKLTPVD